MLTTKYDYKKLKNMKTFEEALKLSFKKRKEGYYSFKFGDGFELALEPLLFDGQFYLALYQNQQPLIEKVVVKAGFTKNKTCSICKRQYESMGNNPAPVAKGRCCDVCNASVVIPARIERMNRK